MKLRNKKTGEVAEVYLDNYTATNNIVSVCLKVKDDVSSDGYKYIASYTNLVELLEEWEDYVSEKPRIEDEKIRKLVREWANMNNLIEFEVYVSTVELKFIGWADGCDIGQTMSFSYSEADFDTSDIESFKRYTITELCGEEE